MTSSMKRTLLIIGVLISVAFGISYAMHVRAQGVPARHVPVHYEGGVKPIPYEPMLRVDRDKRHKVTDWKGSVVNIGVARAPGCKGVRVTDRATNFAGEFLFTISASVRWCWAHGYVTSSNYSVTADAGDQFWNFYEENPGRSPTVKGGCHTGPPTCNHEYRRFRAVFEAKWLGQTFTEGEAWVASTVRGDGSAVHDWKQLHL